MPGPGRRPNRGGKKEKLDLKAIFKLGRYFKPYLWMIVLSVIMAIVGAVCTLIGPTMIKNLVNIITDNIATSIPMDEFVSASVTLLIIYGVGAALTYGQQFVIATITQRSANSIRKDIDRKINALPLNYFDTTTTGDILSRVTNDVDLISQTMGQSFANLVSAFITFIGVIIMMFVVNWILALVTIGSSVLGFFLLAMSVRASQPFFNAKQRHLGTMNGQIEEVFSNHKVVKSYTAESIESAIFEETNALLHATNWKSQFLGGLMMPLMNFTGNLAYALVFVVGFAFYINGNTAITLGVIIEFVMYARLFSQPLSTFADTATQMQQASAASVRVFELLDSTELADESAKTAQIGEVKGQIEFSHVHFGYVPEKTIIEDFSLSVKPGQKVAIVGPTGAGKTTIVNLLMRFYEVGSGDIVIDGVSIKDLKREQVHDLFNMILQDTWLFGGTVRDNLVYNKEGVTDEQLETVIKAVGLKHFVHALPQRFDTVLDDSCSLSEGQKQQMTIARAMIKDAPLLILDEATSNVDTRTEQKIQKAMDELTKGRTSFVIAHRLSTIKNADVILVLRNGNVVETGNHEELMAKGGFYAELYNSQFDTTDLELKPKIA